jgi:hypothetical protein
MQKRDPDRQLIQKMRNRIENFKKDANTDATLLQKMRNRKQHFSKDAKTPNWSLHHPKHFQAKQNLWSHNCRTLETSTNKKVVEGNNIKIFFIPMTLLKCDRRANFMQIPLSTWIACQSIYKKITCDMIRYSILPPIYRNIFKSENSKLLNTWISLENANSIALPFVSLKMRRVKRDV